MGRKRDVASVGDCPRAPGVSAEGRRDARLLWAGEHQHGWWWRAMPAMRGERPAALWRRLEMEQDAEGWRRAHEGHRRSFSPGELASGVLRCFSTNAVGAAALLHLTPDGERNQHANTPRCHREPT